MESDKKESLYSVNEESYIIHEEQNIDESTSLVI